MTNQAEKESIVRIQSYIRDEVDNDRSRRFQREKKRSDEIELAFRRLNSFEYIPFDYSPALVRRTFTPSPIPDYSYLLDEARLKVVNRYHAPLMFQAALGLVCVLASLAFQDSFVPIIGAAGLLACAISMHRDLRNRQRSVELAMTTARSKIEDLIKEAYDNIEKARKELEDEENIRTGKVESLLNGDSGAIFEKMEDVISHFKLPFYMRCTVDYYNEPVITMHLPDQSIIPAKLVHLTSAGNIDYEEKSAFQINKQYSEAIAGTAMNIAANLFAHIPTLNIIYIHGLFDKWQEEEYYFSLRITRQQLIEAVSCRTAFEAFNMTGAEHDLKTSGAFSPIEPIFPDWWEKVPKEKIKSFKVACKAIY